MKFPNMVYRCPGPHQRPGGTFAYRGVNSQSELDALIKDGWFETLPEAAGEKVAVTQLVESNELEVLGDNSPPSRAELEQQAGELCIKFTKKTTDADLNKLIDESLRS